MKARDLLAVAKAISDLVRSSGGVLGGDCGPDAEVHINTPKLRAAANALLAKLVAEHLCVPFPEKTDTAQTKTATKQNEQQ